MLDLRLKMFKKGRLRRGCAPSRSSIFNLTSHIPPPSTSSISNLTSHIPPPSTSSIFNQTSHIPPPSTSSIFNQTSHIPSGMSLIEVLISMFVLLFGLMGVAAIFPVGNFYVVEGEKFDLASGLAQNAFEELRARGMLQPEVWMLTDHFQPLSFNTDFITSTPTNPGTFTLASPNSGNAIVIDPLGGGAIMPTSAAPLDRTYFPYPNPLDGTSNPWPTLNFPSSVVSPANWPVRRVSLPIPNPAISATAKAAMTTEIAETIFRLRDDLAVEQPDESDVPSIQRWDVDGANNLLRRQYKGNYSWLATIVPTTGAGLAALQPANADYGNISYDVSVVVFRKRDETPSDTSERLIEAELLQGGELVIFDRTNVKQNVDDAVDDIRSGNWISLMGVNQTTGDFVMKWYRILSMDDETVENQNFSTVTGQVALRRLMLIGPDWPAPTVGTVVTDLRACILPGAISVVTKPLRMESSSLWSLE